MEVDGLIKEGLTAMGLFVVGKMKFLVRVDAGRRKSSLTYDTEDKKLYVGSGEVSGQPVFYATFAEKNRPFIRPSVFDNARDINIIANKVFRKEL